MKKKEQGILTVEASIVLTLCTMFLLFLFSFARVYNAQSLVSHAVLQTSDAVALESYWREEIYHGDAEEAMKLANKLDGTNSFSAENLKSLRSADVPKIAKEKFIYAISNSESKTNEKLKSLGVKDGIAGMNFSSSRMDLGSDDVIIYVNYTIEMQFPFFGLKEINATKAAKSKTFGDILFGIETIAQDPTMGTATGGGSYKHGTEVQISATPFYGYKFVKWADGSTANPRTVVVTGVKTYVAIFEADAFGVNVDVSPSGTGIVSGGGKYKYLEPATITATPNTGYHFTRWTIYKHKDKVTVEDTNSTVQLNIDQSYSCTAYFEENVYNVKVKTQGASGGAAQITHNGRVAQSVSAKYKSNFVITAPAINGYRFLGWKEEGSTNYFTTSSSVTLTVPAKNVTYIACYESNTKTVRFYGANNQLYAVREVQKGRSLGSNMPPNPRNIGSVFNGWSSGFSQYTIVNKDMDVYSSWRGCSTHRAGDCGVVHTINAQRLNSHSSAGYTKKCMCIVCADCGVYLNYTYKYVASGTRAWSSPNGTIYISPCVWCIEHVSPSGRCESYKNSHSAGTYPVH